MSSLHLIQPSTRRAAWARSPRLYLCATFSGFAAWEPEIGTTHWEPAPSLAGGKSLPNAEELPSKLAPEFATETPNLLKDLRWHILFAKQTPQTLLCALNSFPKQGASENFGSGMSRL